MADFNFIETDASKIYNSVLDALMQHCNEALYPGDERRIFGEALVEVLVLVFNLFDDRSKQRTLDGARGNVLDALGKRLNVYRLEASAATATFRFMASAAQPENIIIPEGTRITTDGSVYFATQEATVLPAGELSVDVPGVCTSTGAAYNGYSAETISTLVDLIPFVAGAANIDTSVGGDDGEPYTVDGDNKFRERIRLAPSALSTAGSESGYKYFVMSADPDIIDVAMVCPEDEPNTVNLYPLMKGGGIPDADTLKKVLEAVSGAMVRPMTDSVHAYPPEQVEYDVELKYYCTKEDEPTLIQAIEADGGAIDKYNEWQTAALDRDIDPDQLRSFIFEAKSASAATGTVRMDIVKPVLTAVGKSQVPKFSGNLIVSHEVTA